MEGKLAIVFTDFFSFGPGGLHAPPVVVDESEAGHYFGPGSLRPPPVVADESIIDFITYKSIFVQ